MSNFYYTDLNSLISNYPQKIDIINKSYIDLLTQLTNSNYLDNDIFVQQINNIYANNSKIFISYLSNPNCNDFIVVGTVTCFLQPKIIRNARFAAYIEDVVVHKDFRNNGIAGKLLLFAKDFAIKNNCYKILLNCEDSLIPFYNKYGFQEKGRYMTQYLY